MNLFIIKLKKINVCKKTIFKLFINSIVGLTTPELGGTFHHRMAMEILQ